MSLQEELKNCRLDIHAPVDEASADNSKEQRSGIEDDIRHEYSLHAGKKISAVIALIRTQKPDIIKNSGI